MMEKQIEWLAWLSIFNLISGFVLGYLLARLISWYKSDKVTNVDRKKEFKHKAKNFQDAYEWWLKGS